MKIIENIMLLPGLFILVLLLLLLGAVVSLDALCTQHIDTSIPGEDVEIYSLYDRDSDICTINYFNATNGTINYNGSYVPEVYAPDYPLYRLIILIVIALFMITILIELGIISKGLAEFN